MLLSVVGVAAVWGGVAGRLVPRAAHRLAVAPGEPWRASCPRGHDLTGGLARGWVGGAWCRDCGVEAGADAGARAGGRVGAGSGAFGPSTPVLAALTAVLCAALAGAVGVRPETLVWLALVPFGVLLAVVDHAVHRLPDVLTLPLAAAALVLLGLAAQVEGAGGSWQGVLWGGLVLGGVYFALFLAHPSGMGFGDVKLAMLLGVTLGWYGWGALLLGFFAGVLYGGGYALALVLRGRAGRKTAMPFGPCMLAGAFSGLLLGGLGA
nr:A24 family peptidase [Streptomyces apocyni]